MNHFINYLKDIKFLIEKHEILTFANVFSLICGIIPAIFILCTFEPENKISGFIYLIPIPIVYLISLAAYFLFKKFSKISKVFSFLLNTFIIVIFQIMLAMFLFSGTHSHDIEVKCNKLENYPMALKYMDVDSRVRHFPVKIPDNAKNVYLYAGIDSFFGSKSLYLKFYIDKKYINEELKKYKFIKIKPYKELENLEYNFYCSNINLEDYILYIIGDKQHEIPNEASFPYHYGIAVNPKTNEIIYYYENPD